MLGRALGQGLIRHQVEQVEHDARALQQELDRNVGHQVARHGQRQQPQPSRRGPGRPALMVELAPGQGLGLGRQPHFSEQGQRMLVMPGGADAEGHVLRHRQPRQ